MYFRDRGPTEIGGFALTAADDLLYVEQFVTVKQGVTAASISFDDEAVADFFDGQVDAGRKPEQFARIWLHSHPGESASPSIVDEETFDRAFGGCQWALMFIVGQTGKTTARLRFNVGPGGHVALPVEVDYSLPFAASDLEAWEAEYQANITPEAYRVDYAAVARSGRFSVGTGTLGTIPSDLMGDLQEMSPSERAAVLSDLTDDERFYLSMTPQERETVRIRLEAGLGPWDEDGGLWGEPDAWNDGRAREQRRPGFEDDVKGAVYEH